MKTRERLLSGALAAVLALCAGGAALADSIDFTGYAVGSPDLEATLGPKVAELDAVAYGFSFGAVGLDPYRNLNIISQVYQADHAVVVGTGVNGTEISLQPGDLTFAYTLDYSVLSDGVGNSPVNDFQLYRVIDDQYFNMVSNPGPWMALDAIIAGAYNTAAEFGGGAGTPAFEPYPNGLTCEEIDAVGFQTDEVEFAWPTDDQVDPGMKAMVFMFLPANTGIWQIGWGSADGLGVDDLSARQLIGETGEGGNVVGGGSRVKGIPILVPVPEPVSMVVLTLGAMACLLRRRR